MKSYYLNFSEFHEVLMLLEMSDSRVIKWHGLIIEDLGESGIVCAYCNEILSGDFHWMLLVED